MRKSNLIFLFVLMVFGLGTKAQSKSSKTTQNLSIVNHWFEAPESTKGDTVAFKLSKHVLGPNDDPAYAWSEFEVNANNTFDIKYWRWCSSGNSAYNGTWSTAPSGKILFDFGAGKCKCEMEIISSTATELRAIIKETTN